MAAVGAYQIAVAGPLAPIGDLDSGLAIVAAATQCQTTEQPLAGTATRSAAALGISEQDMRGAPGVLIDDGRPCCQTDDLATVSTEPGVTRVYQDSTSSAVIEPFT